jgi:hypothetical protein
MRPEHFRALRAAIVDAVGDRLESVRAQYQARGLSDQRFRWDALWAVPAKVRDPLMKELYTYLNDSHIDTALKTIVGVSAHEGLGAADEWKETWDWAANVWGRPDPGYAFNAFFRSVASRIAEREGWEEVGSSDVWHASFGAVQYARKQGVTTRKELIQAVLDYQGIGAYELGATVGLTTDPYHRALERIDALIERGEDAERGTLRRLYATEDPDKIVGIYLAAQDYGWDSIVYAAMRQYRDVTRRKHGRALDIKKRAGQLSGVEIQEKDFPRVANMIAYGASPADIREQLRKEGYDDTQIYFIYKAAQQILAREVGGTELGGVDFVPEGSDFGVNKYAHGYELVHLATGRTVRIGDGTDRFYDDRDRALRPGTSRWWARMKDWLVNDAGEVYDAYFSDL